jgi:Mg/Co/Ni transporter MgtE
VNDENIVVGHVRAEALQDAAEPVHRHMEPGPTTVRADESLDALTRRMEQHNAATIIVTDPDGHLLGTVHVDDARRYLDEAAR